MAPRPDPFSRIAAAAPRARPHTSVRWILREATAEEHARCERLLGPLTSWPVYARFLTAKAVFCSAVLQAASRRLPAETVADLRGDLERIASDRTVTGARADLPAVPALAARSAADAVGMLYVAEGARLGATVLHRQAAAALGVSAHHGARFLAGGGGKARWTTFLDALESTVATPADLADAIGGARAAFDVFGRALAPAVA